MAQVLKDDVERRIRGAALSVFAQRGFAAAGMAEIARAAGISPGNVYRYFASKELLFEAVVPRALSEQLLSLLRRRVRALSGERDVHTLPGASPFHAASQELLNFAVAHRLEVAVLLGRAEGSIYQGFAERVRRMLEKLALYHFIELDPGFAATPGQRAVLTLVYQNLITSTVAILLAHEQEAQIREAVNRYGDYHLAGLARLLG